MEPLTRRPELRCSVCGAPDEGGWRCRCGGPLDLPDVPATGIDTLAPAAAGDGLWRYAPWIPVPGSGLSMGEGQTALIGAGESLPDVWLKLEFVSPTGSFKDRGAVALVASAVARGAARLIADSSGNAGSAIAAYAARAGLPCAVFVPAGTSAGKRGQILAYGADLQVVAGGRSEAAQAAIAAVAQTGATYASHVYDPMFLQGTKTFAYECWERLGRAPDAVLVPVGNGTLLLGAARGFRELRAAGVIESLPRLIALQSERCAPLACAWARGPAAPAPAPVEAGATVAEGIAIPSPPRGAQILAAVLETGGAVLSVSEAAIAPAQRDLARRGLLVEPTAAVAWAGAQLLRGGTPEREPWRAAAELCRGTVVVPLCGSGLKSG